MYEETESEQGRTIFQFFSAKKKQKKFFSLSSTETIHLRERDTYIHTYMDNREIKYNIEI
jgi:hypothetical protein